MRMEERGKRRIIYSRVASGWRSKADMWVLKGRFLLFNAAFTIELIDYGIN